MKRLLLICMLSVAWGVAATKPAVSGRALPALIPYPQQVEVTGPYMMPLLNVKVEIDSTLDLPAEGYVLETYKKGVRITAKDERGAIWARQTLRQLVDAKAWYRACGLSTGPPFRGADSCTIRGVILSRSRIWRSILTCSRAIRSTSSTGT